MSRTMPAFRFIEVEASHKAEVFAEVVEVGLSRPQKFLPSRFFYDKFGSALFEKICELPEYYLTRTEEAILRRYAEEMVARVGDEVAMVEFGSGSSAKTRLLIDAALSRQNELHYIPIDISRDFLRHSSLELQDGRPGLIITALAAEYDDAIDAIPQHNGPRLFLILGSNIGNFSDEEARDILSRVRGAMESRDRLLVGIDLIKDRAIIELAYNDSQGVTQAFNKNLLGRINRELGGTFGLDDFAHKAMLIDNERIESYLVAKERMSVYIAGLHREFHFAEGESVHTETSHKYTLERFGALVGGAGLMPEDVWTDDKRWFAVVLLRRSDA